MAVQQTATLVANYVLTVESNNESENDESMEDDGDDSDEVQSNDARGETGSEDEARDEGINENEQGDKHNKRFDAQSGHEALPDLLPKKGIKSEVW